MKGIILAGGKGTRLYPMTKVVSKQLLPIYDKPMIYYPLSILLLAQIKEILIISTPIDIHLYMELLGDGSQLGISIVYAVQDKPKGLAEAFIIGEKFIGNDKVCLILGDNIFYGQGITGILNQAIRNEKATIFGYQVKDPREFGVVEFDKKMNVISLDEKPQIPKSNYAIPGIYFYNSDVVSVSKAIKPSERGELEITAVNKYYLNQGNLKVEILGRGIAWLDTGTPEGMLKASLFVESLQSRQGSYISCIEEIAYKRNLISLNKLKQAGEELKMTDYGKYILKIVDEEKKME